MEDKNRRKILLINPKFQLSMITFFSMVSMGVIFTFYGSIYYFFNIFKENGKEMGFLPGDPFFLFIDEQIFRMNFIFFVASAISMLLLFVSGLYISHKIAGPLYNLRKFLERVNAGAEEDEVHFRKGDYFLEIESLINKNIKYMKSKKRMAGNFSPDEVENKAS